LGSSFSAPVQTIPMAHPASCTVGTGSLPGVKSGWGVTLTPHPLLVPLVMKEWSYTSTTPMGRTACTEPQCLYKGDLYLFFISPYIWRSFFLYILGYIVMYLTIIFYLYFEIISLWTWRWFLVYILRLLRHVPDANSSCILQGYFTMYLMLILHVHCKVTSPCTWC